MYFPTLLTTVYYTDCTPLYPIAGQLQSSVDYQIAALPPPYIPAPPSTSSPSHFKQTAPHIGHSSHCVESTVGRSEIYTEL